LSQVAAGHQLAAVEAAFGVDLVPCSRGTADFVVGQEVELGDADAVLAGDHAVERCAPAP
jgi:hypothetical protein